MGASANVCADSVYYKQFAPQFAKSLRTAFANGSLGENERNIESLMSCHLLLNLLHELANMILCEALPSIISFLPTNVINLVINDNEFEILFIT